VGKAIRSARTDINEGLTVAGISLIDNRVLLIVHMIHRVGVKLFPRAAVPVVGAGPEIATPISTILPLVTNPSNKMWYPQPHYPQLLE
jgi:hypothetical protein